MLLFLEQTTVHQTMLITRKKILVLGEGQTQGKDDTSITAEAKYFINFTKSEKIFLLSIHFNGSNCFLFVNIKKIYQFKEKDSERKLHLYEKKRTKLFNFKQDMLRE